MLQDLFHMLQDLLHELLDSAPPHAKCGQDFLTQRFNFSSMTLRIISRPFISKWRLPNDASKTRIVKPMHQTLPDLSNHSMLERRTRTQLWPQSGRATMYTNERGQRNEPSLRAYPGVSVSSSKETSYLYCFIIGTIIMAASNLPKQNRFPDQDPSEPE